ncbi:hypothetical protein AGENTSMITH_165 [Bacillus phage vB_BspM_AgentSmith]|nr:hypothetical protein AGENTSMITH_165 [Bacillus phage vB_BspM_AgentSmith]
MKIKTKFGQVPSKQKTVAEVMEQRLEEEKAKRKTEEKKD